MAIGKRLRFQIFRRDNFACRYCGRTADAGAVLEVDHIKPRAEGGEDHPTNLITACENCNSGKSDILLGAPLVEDVPQADFRAAMADRGMETEVEEIDLDPMTARASEIETAAGLWWSVAFPESTLRQSHDAMVSAVLAIACGHSEEDILAAVRAAAEARQTDLTPYLPELPEDDEEPEEETDYAEALKYLAKFIPSERSMLIWRARLAAGDYQPTRRELIRAAEGQGRWYVEEMGRNRDALRNWLGRLPNGEGTRCLQRATAEWDEALQGRPGHAAVECPDEVLELAVALSLSTDVPR